MILDNLEYDYKNETAFDKLSGQLDEYHEEADNTSIPGILMAPRYAILRSGSAREDVKVGAGAL